ncbi:hypothetical protein BJV82DRAFT_718093 [Fennellomyces sp. T-0311]|nr:hypothetical protein BJV82DRAFT_718093 [Fennellomyces sp. T-0311]
MTDNRKFQSLSKRRRLYNDLGSTNGATDQQIQLGTTGICNGDAITSLTEELKNLDNRRAVLLVARAKAYSSIGRLADAISDALKAIEADPMSAEAYFVAGDAYSTQGKQQEAVNIYEQGLRTVLPSEWPLLYEGRIVPRQQMARRIDFVAKLPLEITRTIFDHAEKQSHSSPTRYAEVSKLWRDTVLFQCPSLWDTVNISDQSFGYHLTTLHVLPFIATHVRVLKMRDLSDRNLQRVIAIAESGRFSLVKSVTVESLPRLFESWVPLITALRNSLTMLTIKLLDKRAVYPAAVDGSIFSLDSVLSLCPKLRFLSLKSNSPVTYQPPQQPPSNGYQLLVLCLDILDHDEVLARLLPHCPQVQAFFTRYSPSPHTVSLIHRACPRLRHFGTTPKTSRRDAINPIKTPIADYYQDSPDDHDTENLSGLDDLEYYGPLTHRVLSLLIESKDTLRKLDLGAKNMLEIIVDQTIYSRLTVLCLSMSSNHDGVLVPILQQCPILEEVYLSFVSRQVILDDICTSLTMHDHLRILKFGHFKMETTRALEQLFAHYASRHQSCRLQQISISSCDCPTADGTVFESLADITTVRSIELRRSFSNMNEHCLATFVHKLATMPYLQSLCLCGLHNITDDVLVGLAKIDGLESLELGSLGRISANDGKATSYLMKRARNRYVFEYTFGV